MVVGRAGAAARARHLAHHVDLAGTRFDHDDGDHRVGDVLLQRRRDRRRAAAIERAAGRDDVADQRQRDLAVGPDLQRTARAAGPCRPRCAACRRSRACSRRPGTAPGCRRPRRRPAGAGRRRQLTAGQLPGGSGRGAQQNAERETGHGSGGHRQHLLLVRSRAAFLAQWMIGRASAARRQRVGVDAVSRIAGGADRDAQRLVEFVVLDAGHQAVDDPQGVLEIGVEQHERRACPCRCAPSRSVSRTSRPMSCATSCTARSSALTPPAFPLAAGFGARA